MSDEATILYLAGQMRGKENLNFDAFAEYAEKLRDAGFVVINPAEKVDGYKDLPREWFMEYSVKQIMMADAVAVMPSWEDSPGAKIEAWLAQQLSKPVVEADDPEKGVYIEDIDFFWFHYPENIKP